MLFNSAAKAFQLELPSQLLERFVILLVGEIVQISRNEAVNEAAS